MAHIITKNTDCFLSKIRNAVKMSAPTTLIHNTGGSRRIRQGKEEKDIEIKKKLFAENIIVYVENPKESTKTNSYNKCELSKVTR